MKKLAIVSIFIIITHSCKVAKNGSQRPNSEQNISSKKLNTGIFEPTEKELNSIAFIFNDATLEQLKKGYSIYSDGACVTCHKAKSIYQYEISQWKNIIDDMAKEAKLNSVEKDAVYKYVISIKSSQPK